jgi:addiction module HigA family antidote
MPSTWKSLIIIEVIEMTTNKMRPIHPGEILREEYLEPLGLSANALALALRVPATRVGEIVHERRGISPDTALRLARYFGTDAQSWMNLQTSYDLKIAVNEHGKVIEQEVSRAASA